MPDKRATLAELFRGLLKRLGFDGYDPARHYMRGPGPKSRAVQRPDEQQAVESRPVHEDGRPDDRRH